MEGPPLEVADLVRAAGQGFLVHSRKWLCGQHLKVLSAIARCRTAALGGHRLRCDGCDHEPPIVYNSCLDRHCPKCQAGTRKRWLEARRKELLPVRYLHVVFTLPRLLSQLALQNKKAIYSLLMRASAETLLKVARDPQHLGAEIGFFSILPAGTRPRSYCRSRRRSLTRPQPLDRRASQKLLPAQAGLGGSLSRQVR